MKVYAIDLDGTLQHNGVGIASHIRRVNDLFNTNGNTIIIYTARAEAIRPETERLLAKLDVHYHALVMNKLRADVYVDDRSQNWGKR
jgi:hypothetical protein